MSAEDAGLNWLRWEIDKAEANIRWLETTEAALGREMDRRRRRFVYDSYGAFLEVRQDEVSQESGKRRRLLEWLRGLT